MDPKDHPLARCLDFERRLSRCEGFIISLKAFKFPGSSRPMGMSLIESLRSLAENEAFETFRKLLEILNKDIHSSDLSKVPKKQL